MSDSQKRTESKSESFIKHVRFIEKNRVNSESFIKQVRFIEKNRVYRVNHSLNMSDS